MSQMLPRGYCSLSVLICAFFCVGSCFAGPEPGVPAGTILRPVIKGRLAASRLRSGSVLDGEFTKPVYWRDRQLIPAGSALHLIVDNARKMPGLRPGLLRRALRLATNSVPPSASYDISVRSARLTLPGGSSVPIDVAMLALLNQDRVYARDGKVRKQRDRRSTLILEVKQDFSLPQSTQVRGGARNEVSPLAITLPAGSRALVTLTQALSGSRSGEGDAIEAKVVQPVIVDGNIAIPEGSRLEGRIVRRKAPRRLGRAAALRLNFNKLILPDGAAAEVATALSAADTDISPHTHLDSEGGISGGSTSKKRLALDLGVSYLTGKVADDLLEEGIKYALGAAVSGSATVAARYVGIGTGLFFFAMQKGNDVRLPQYSELELTFSRAVTFAAKSRQNPTQ